MLWSQENSMTHRSLEFLLFKSQIHTSIYYRLDAYISEMKRFEIHFELPTSIFGSFYSIKRRERIVDKAQRFKVN